MKETSKTYVDIASLFDLRQAALQKTTQSEEKLIEYLLSEEYNFRETDIFPMVNKDQYDSISKSKDLKLLELSSVTYILTTVKSKIANTEYRNSYYKENKLPEVVLNVFPFELTQEQQDSVQNLLFIKLKAECLITVTYMDPKDITPSFIKGAGFVSCFMYDFPGWVDYHIRALENIKLEDCVLHFASLRKNDLTKEEEASITKLGFKDVFSYTEFLFSSVANIRFLPAVFYSNVLTSMHYIEKFNKDLKKETTSSGNQDVDISKFNLPDDI